jgi:DNA-binding response OmpR family regulator
VIVCSFHASAQTRADAAERGADAYLTKPLSPRELYPVLSASRVAASSVDARL